jgi:lysozyme family protein
MDFDKAFDNVIAVEGGYVNDPADRGGETYKGIARKMWPYWKGWATIDAKSRYPNFPKCLETSSELDDYVREFYKVRFWQPLRCDDVPAEIRLELFDTGVNQGIGTAVTHLQRALNLLNDNGRLYADLKVDGGIGPVTVATANRCPDKRALHNTMNILQGMQYVTIAERNPVQQRFFRGWILNRVSWM